MSPVRSPTDPIEDHEGMLRRVPVTAWGSDKSQPPPVKAFLPLKPIPKSGHPGDVDGLSVSRESITSVERASRAPTGKRYHVARLTAGAIREAGVSIKADPKEHDLGHCLLPEINIRDYLESNEKKRRIKEHAAKLAQSCNMILIVSK